uniref:CUB domain-containing protein n=1 Tax=Caenorhabditis tropicalis TaxID=1561998 RepID=A0A1I7T0S4_9PELO
MRWRSVLYNGSKKDELSEENGSKNEEVPVDAEGDNTDNGETDGSEDTTIPTVPTSTIQTTTLDYCHCEMEIYGTDDLSGTLKSPNYPGAHCDNGKCMYKILPHPNMTLRLHVETLDVSSGTTVKFWNILIVDDKEYNMYHSTSGSSEADFGGYEHFTTAVNVGMKVVFEMRKNSYSSKGFKMIFDRKLNDSSNYVCPDAHVVVGGEPTAVSVPKMFSVYSGCICALFDDKEYRNGGFLSVTISGSCRLIHCHWKFSAEQDYSLQYITIEFIMDNPHTSDRVYVITDELEEEYDSEILTRRMNSLTSNMGPIDFTFSRFGLTNSEDAVLNITWKTTEACSCASEKFYVKVGEPVVIASPNYPNSYCPNLVCRHTFFAPKGYYLEVSMDEVDLEKYHDYLKIYDGNGTVSPLIAKLTGNEKPSVYNTTSDTLFISFVTDETNSEKGYHANINARPMKIVSDENHNTHWVIFIAIIVLIIGISLGAAIAVLRKEPAVPRRRTQTLENPNSQINPFADGFELGVTVPSASPDQAATY